MNALVKEYTEEEEILAEKSSGNKGMFMEV